ncbi:MAG TPA: hypothetical protein VLV82_07685 [Candidatus Angelobacter sp.]|nr:hypothetical protein [Candidatus Angelobacter sp.]
MQVSRTIVAAAFAVSALALVAQPASAASGPPLLVADAVPSQPTDASIFGVHAGAVPWVLDDGTVHVQRSGRTDVHLEGLQVLRSDGTTDNPIASITVDLYCGGVLVAMSAPQPLSVPAGDARFRVQLDVPATCADATALISPAASHGAVYIASAVASADGD